MVIRDSEHKVETLSNVFNGNGDITFKRIIQTPEELYNKGRVFSVSTTKPGCSLGNHTHHDEEEFYYILSGEGEYYDNGTTVTVKAGDTTICRDGETHGIVNNGTEDLVLVALIIYK